MKIFALALALVAGASSSSAALPKVGGSAEVDCFQQCAQVALEGHNKKNCKQDCIVMYCEVDDDDDDEYYYDDDDDRNGRKKKNKRKRKNRRRRGRNNGRNGRIDDDRYDDDFVDCKVSLQ